MPLHKGRPLFIVDCDEVILHQAGPVSAWLASDHGIDLPLSGRSACYRADGSSVAPSEVTRLMRLFAETQLHRQTLVEGAKEALEAFAAVGDVVILTNVPVAYRQARVEQLASHGIYYPVECNTGLKGRAVTSLVACFEAYNITFIDDDPRHHNDVALHAPEVELIQLIGDEKLATFIRKADAPARRAVGWKDTRAMDLVLRPDS